MNIIHKNECVDKIARTGGSFFLNSNQKMNAAFLKFSVLMCIIFVIWAPSMLFTQQSE